MITAPAIRALGFLSAWGRGAIMLPEDAALAAEGRQVLSLGRPAMEGDRFRRATRECLLGFAAVKAMLEDAEAPRAAIAGERTALLYVTAASYAGSNRAFIERGARGAYFPYTAPAVVPAEVAIEFGLTGPYAIFIGGPPATLRAIWYAATLLDGRLCDRALVLAVETFEESADLYARARRLVRFPLVESAGCLWLTPGAGALSLECAPAGGRPDDGGVRRRLGEAFSCEPLAALDLWRAGRGSELPRLRGRWRGEAMDLAWLPPRPIPDAPRSPAASPAGASLR